MTEYFQRLKSGCSKGTYAFWWLLRIATVGIFIESLFREPLNPSALVQTGTNFACMFIWELCMAMPEKSFARLLPSSLQTALNVGLFVAAFGGRYLNLYYNTAWFEPIFEFVFGGFTVFAGYEIACAYVRKEKRTATKAMLYYVAFGVGFIAANVLEIFEFSADQVIGLITGTCGDNQFWSYELVEGTARENMLLSPIVNERWALMDTMNDIVLNTVSAFTALLILNLYPYRQKGRFRYTDMVLSVAEVLPKEKLTLKIYKERLKNSCTKSTYILWWIIRGCMLCLIVYSFTKKPFNFIEPVELAMNLACMFIWEIVMAMPNKNVFRYISPVLQTIITVGDFIAVVAGYLFNFYYEVRLWDSFMHFFCGVLAVYFGYEITCALIKMERRTASLKLVIIASVGFCIMATTFWEIFEFSCDQLVGIIKGTPHDVQHWNYMLAQGTAKLETIFDPINIERWPLMDTMGDIVLNVSGAFLGFLGIKFYPYRHKGKLKFDFNFEEKVIQKQ